MPCNATASIAAVGSNEVDERGADWRSIRGFYRRWVGLVIGDQLVLIRQPRLPGPVLRLLYSCRFDCHRDGGLRFVRSTCLPGWS